MAFRIKVALLGVVGLLVAGFSFVAFKHSPSLSCLMEHTAMARGTLASAGCSDAAAQTDDIFFVSCGGIY